MKQTLKFFALAFLMIAFTVNAFAQVTTQTTTATATIVGPLNLTKNVDLAFGKIAPGTGGSVTVATNGNRTTTGPLLMGGTVTAASFTVTGDAAAYSITFSTGNTIVNGGNTMAVGTFTENAVKTLATGTENFQVGATLTVGAAQAVGPYTGTFTVTVAYN